MAQVAGQQVNDDLRLEEDADAMGAKAIRDSRAGVQRKENASREEFSFVSQPKYPIQRAKVNPERVDEENWAEARHGETIRFTDLSAGCMAVTVVFHDSGGGAGVHMLMTKDNATQWAPFSVFVAGKVIDAVFIDGDMIGGRDGWRVKIKYSEEEEGEGEYRITNETGFCPRSGADLMTTYGSLEAAEGAGWTQNTDLIKPWFQELFRTETVELTGKTKGVSHAC